MGAISAWLTGFWSGETTAVRIAFVAGLAVLLSALAIAIALIVRSDVDARARATVAEYGAREGITRSFLALVHAGATQQPSANAPASDLLLPMLAAHLVLNVRGDDIQDDTVVIGVRKTSEGRIELETSNDWIPAERIKTFSLTQPIA